MRGDLRIRAAKDRFLGDTIELLAAIVNQRSIDAAQPVVFSPSPEGDEVRPFLRLHPEAAQALMDSLWECGVRPTQGAGTAGAFAAQGAHLEDMRRLVFEARR